MPKHDISDSESEDANENSSSEEAETATATSTKGLSEYEKQRLSRIAENRARLEALGLPKISSSLKGLGHKVTDKKGKKKVADDEEYMPDAMEARSSSSSGEDGHDNDEYKDFVSEKVSRSRKRKVRSENVTMKLHLFFLVKLHLFNAFSYSHYIFLESFLFQTSERRERFTL